jgi:hypothetical protein
VVIFEKGYPMGYPPFVPVFVPGILQTVVSKEKNVLYSAGMIYE